MKTLLTACLILCIPLAATPVTTTDQLLKAVGKGGPIELAAGTFQLAQPLVIPSGTTLKGAGLDKTILTHIPEWHGRTDTLPDPETNRAKFDKTAYLVHLADKAQNIEIADLTLTAPRLHGAIYGSDNSEIHLHHLKIQDCLYSGFRSYSLKRADIHDCTFIDAGQRWERGQPGLKGGITGGGIFAIWIADSEIHHNRFLDTKEPANLHYYGIKGRQGKRVRIHHNNIGTNFSIEFPFENDEDVEISHNILRGTVSIPKGGGGPVPASGRTFHIHHNLFEDSYAIEFVRNGVEIDHNLFRFDPAKDHGNLISGFGRTPAKGPAAFHNNVVLNPGRGVIWINEPYDHLTIRNNHIIARTTATPRTDGLFGFNAKSDFSTLSITDNIITAQGQPRPLLRATKSYQAEISNNLLSGIADADRIPNPKADRKQGLEQPLAFECGVHGELTVTGEQTQPTRRPSR